MFGRTRAPELTGRGWLNTGGRTLDLQQLRGKIVLLDFWTFCCINCIHVIDELRPLEERYADSVVVIGVHSPKFEHEQNAEAVAAAVERYGVEHPVLDDPLMSTWRQYAVRAWPTLCVIDPEGYLVGSVSGEGHAEGLADLFDDLIRRHEAKGSLVRGELDLRQSEDVDETRALSFPGKLIELPSGNLLCSSSASHQLVELRPYDLSVVRRIGSGERGRVDGDADVARFNEPQGMCLLPDYVAQHVGYDVVVADTVNHQLRGLRLAGGAVTTIAGTGSQLRVLGVHAAHDAGGAQLSSPWDVEWFDDVVVIAMAGVHQLWWFDPMSSKVGVYAGTAAESLRDGGLLSSCLAQPSGLSSDGTNLWLADSETSSLRWTDGEVISTAVGSGLFDFGHVDGPARRALLQHPLGVAVAHDGGVLVADTYNGAIRRYEMATDTVSTVMTGLMEPSDVLVTDEATYIVESAAHRVVRLEAPSVVDRAVVLAPIANTGDEIVVRVDFVVPAGQKLDSSLGSPFELSIDASPVELVRTGLGSGNELSRVLALNAGVLGSIDVHARIATCDVEAEHPVCNLTTQSWSIPVTSDGALVTEVTLTV